MEKAGANPVFAISAPLEEGLVPLLDSIIARLGDQAREDREASADERSWSPL